jgi:hypothetical protein
MKILIAIFLFCCVSVNATEYVYQRGVAGATGVTGATGSTGATGLLAVGATGSVPYYNGAAWVPTSVNLYNSGTKVGIGTTNPIARLQINSPVDYQVGLTTSSAISLYNATGLNELSQIGFGYSDGSTYKYVSAFIAYINESTSEGGKGSLLLGTKNGTSAATIPSIVMALKSTGNVGIGNTNPASTLQIGSPLTSTTNYLQIDTLAADTAGPPAAYECGGSTQTGRMVLSSRYTATADNMIWVCLQTAASTYAWWKTALTAP